MSWKRKKTEVLQAIPSASVVRSCMSALAFSPTTRYCEPPAILRQGCSSPYICSNWPMTFLNGAWLLEGRWNLWKRDIHVDLLVCKIVGRDALASRYCRCNAGACRLISVGKGVGKLWPGRHNWSSALFPISSCCASKMERCTLISRLAGFRSWGKKRYTPLRLYLVGVPTPPALVFPGERI
jgi:hypothetical protein